jgi:Sec-independent protein translocase protein TatA
MVWWVVLLVVVVAVLAYRYRVPLLARLLGQSESRVRRQLERRRD